MSRLENKRTIVTGGSTGIGLEMVRSLVGKGAEVTAIARHDDKLAAARDAGARSIAGDATDAALMARAIEDLDPDILVLNAGARLAAKRLDHQNWEDFSAIWNTDVKATFVGIQAALDKPLRPGSRVLVTSSGAAMVMSLPAIRPEHLRMSGGYVGAKRMVWFMAHQANAVSRERDLGIRFQVLVPSQLMAGTELGCTVAAAYAEAEGITIDEHILGRYGSHLTPEQVGRQVAELLGDPAYGTGVAYGIRADVQPIPLD
ncbi:SDR family NAD(P)-dependent oxidoreductase [Mesorhizobium sp. ES1-4]|uniref:SDR family NAD(P)-dependent oxidoreductase n=1 Tax=Mesorhizobium sp. ES1-4 TaxID=2876627 RepID=UPI001CCC3098|nr:SDR family oxidoreductase [Mesorhizobium sp. ES1-4]MBZ9796578.1 SDR family oxidoreductase [Mesorhizobium sp. ES1-4]